MGRFTTVPVAFIAMKPPTVELLHTCVVASDSTVQQTICGTGNLTIELVYMFKVVKIIFQAQSTFFMIFDYALYLHSFDWQKEIVRI